MNTLSKTLHLIKLGQRVPNFSIHINTKDTDFDTYRKNKWALLFTHPQYFIPQSRSSFKAFLEMQSFLVAHDTKLVGLNPRPYDSTKVREMDVHLGINSKIIIVDAEGIVRSILVLSEMDYELVGKAVKDIQEDDAKLKMIEKGLGIKAVNINKKDAAGFPPIDFFKVEVNGN